MLEVKLLPVNAKTCLDRQWYTQVLEKSSILIINFFGIDNYYVGGICFFQVFVVRLVALVSYGFVKC